MHRGHLLQHRSSTQQGWDLSQSDRHETRPEPIPTPDRKLCQVLGTALVGRAGITKGLGRWVVAAWEVLPVGPWAYLRDGRIARTLGLRFQYYLRQRCTEGTQDRAT